MVQITETLRASHTRPFTVSPQRLHRVPVEMQLGVGVLVCWCLCAHLAKTAAGSAVHGLTLTLCCPDTLRCNSISSLAHFMSTELRYSIYVKWKSSEGTTTDLTGDPTNNIGLFSQTTCSWSSLSSPKSKAGISIDTFMVFRFTCSKTVNAVELICSTC